MKSVNAKLLNFHRQIAAFLSLLAVCWALPTSVQAIEDPPNCSLANGGLGNTSQGGINFNLSQAHVGDCVPVFASLGMVNNACRAINATGSIYVATGLLTNFLVNVTLDPGLLISCPGGGSPPCTPGPYNICISNSMVGVGVSSPNGSVPGVPNAVRAVENGLGTVQTGLTPEQLADFHTATITIVRPCIRVVKFCPTNCTPAGSPIDFTGYVTNCGDIRLTNVTVVDSRTAILLTPGGLPLFQPLILDPGQAVPFRGSFAPTLAEICAGSAPNTITARGTDITIIGGPNASVTNSTTVSCPICINPCLTVTKLCTPAVLGQPQTVSGGITNCGDIAISNIFVSDDIYGSITIIDSLAAGAGTTYSRTFTATRCGTTTNIVTAMGVTACGAAIQGRATNTCVVTENPCIQVTKNCDTVVVGSANTVSGVVSNCGDITITNVVIQDNLYGQVTTIPFLLPGGSQAYSLLVTNTCGSFTNIVTATGRSTCGTPVSANATNTCVVTENPCIRVTKTCDTVVIGQSNLVTAVVTNCGNVPLHGITVVDNIYGNVGTIALLAPGGTATLRISVTNICGNFTNTVTATGLSPCNTSVTNTSTAVCVVTENPCIAVTKTCDTVVIGQSNLVTAVVTNCGNVPLHGITVVDNIYGSVGTIALLAPGGTATLTMSVTNICGNFTNTVTATGLSPCNTSVTNTSTAVCVVTENPCIRVTKTCDTVVVGQANLVTAVVTNCGNVPLHGITVVDNIYGSVGTIALLAPGGTATLTMSVTNICGNFTNTVTATGLSPCNTSVTNTSTAVCVVTENPCIRVTKTCDTVVVGQANLVTAVVTNCGNVPLHGITVVDNIYGSVGTIALLAPGGTATLTMSVTNLCGNFTNMVTATGLSPCNTSVTNTSTAICVVTENPCIAVTKTCDTVVVGQANVVTAVVTNCGNVPLHGITVVDNIYGSVGTIALLASGGTATLTMSVTNLCGNFTNTVTATGLSPCNTSVTNTSTAICVVTENPCIAVTKTCDAVVVGQANVVTAVVTNCGNVPLHGITVVDNIYGNVGTIALLAPGGTATLTMSVTNLCGNFTNTVTATGLSPCNTSVTNTSTAICVVTENPCIAVTKTCDTVVVGQANVVTAVVTNCGNVPLHGITVVDNIYGNVGNIALLAPGGTATLTISVTNLCGNFTNTVTATGLSPCNTSVTNTSTAICVVTENPCIRVTKTCDTVVVGQPNLVTAVVTNCGNVPLHGITVVDNIYGNVGTIALLAPGGTATLTISVTNLCGNFTNTVTATGLSPCNTSVTNTSTAICVVTENPCIRVTKTCDTVVVGQPNLVTAVVTNCGNVPLHGITVVDNIYGNVGNIASLAPGGTATLTISVTNLCGNFTNTVTATGLSPCNTSVTNTSTAICVVTENPCIAVTKTCDTVVVGQANVVTAVVTNCGNVPLHGITVVDNIYGNVGNIASLAPGGTATLTMSVTNLCGNFTNTVTATGLSPCNTSVTNTSTAVCVVTENPCIAVTKTCDTVVVGQANVVTAVVTNCGNVPLHGITVVDSIYGSVGNIASLAPGGTATLTISVTNLCGNFTNTVTATGLSPCNTSVTNTSTAICVVTENPCIAVTKTCDTVAIGQANLVTAVVTNCGNVPLHDITVVDSIYGSVGSIPSLAPGGTATLTKSVTNICGNFTNTVTATGLSPCNTSVTNTSTAICVVTEAACIQVTKNCDTVLIGLGNTVSGTVTNCGNVMLTNITIVDNLYGTLTTIASLAPGASQNYSRLVTNATCGSFSNIVTATGRSACGTQVSANATSICVVTEAPCIQVTKTCNSVVIGQANVLTAVVTNCGNVPLHDITVVDNIYGSVGTIALLAPGDRSTLTMSVTNTCGNFTNTVTARGLSPCNTAVTNTATGICVVTESPCVAVTANCDTVLIGASNTLSGTVTNCGNVTLTNVTIVDNRYGTVATFATLAPGASQSYSRSVTNDCGNTPNIVTATGRSVCGTEVSANATNTCVVECPPCITVTELIACYDTNNICGPFGETATGVRGDTQLPAFCYSITVSNCGAIALTNVTVIDDKLGDLTTRFFASPATVFPVGGTITYITNGVPLAVNTTNTVIANGQSALTGQNVNASDSVLALVRQASVACSMSVTSMDDLDGNPNDAHVSLLGTGNHNVTFTVVVTAGSVPLANVTITSPTLVGLGCPLPPPFSLPATSNFTYVCTASVNCANIPGLLLTNAAVITAQIDTSTGLCAHDSTGASIQVVSTNSGPPCAVVIECIPTVCLGDFVWDDFNRNGVQDAGEPGISNVVVRLLPCAATNVLASTTTSSNGLYLFCDLAPGSYRVQVVVPTNYLVTLQNAGTNDCVDSDLDPTTRITDCTTLPAGVTNLCTDIGLYRLGAIGDYVWEDLNNNGIQEVGEPGISNLVVRLYDCSSNLLASTTTAANGFYLFTNLPPGGYVVGFTAPSGSLFTLPNVGNDALDSDANAATGFTSCYTLGSGETNLTVDAGLVRRICLGDFVWDDFNRNGVQDAGEPGITNVTLWLQSCGSTNVLQTTVTDTNGLYQFCDLLPGTYQVTVVVPNEYRMTTNSATGECLDSDGLVTTNAPNPTNSMVTIQVILTECLTLLSGTTNNCLDIGLHRPGAIGDYVWEDLNRNGVQEPGEPGISNVVVRLYDCANNLLASTTTSGNGLYLFTNLLPGGYVVGFTTPSGALFTLPNVGNDALDSDANPTTGFTSCYTLGSGETNLTVDAGLVRPICLGDFVWDDLNRNGVQDAGEPGITNVTLWLQSCGSSNVLQTTSTDTNGLYQFCDLQPGTYQVTVVVPNGYRMTTNSATGECLDSDGLVTTNAPNPTNSMVTIQVILTECLTLVSGTTNNCLDIGLHQPGAIGDYVWEDSNNNGIQEVGEPGISNLVVRLYDCSSNLLASTTTGPNGFYLFTNLPPGGYVVGFTTPVGYAFTLVDVGNDALDSDANAATGLTGCYTLGSGETNLTVDAGVFLNCVGSIEGMVSRCVVKPGLPHCHDDCDHDHGWCDRDGGDHSRCNHKCGYCNQDGRDHSGCRHDRGWCDRDGSNHASCNHQGNRCDRDTRNHSNCNHGRNICQHNGSNHDECCHEQDLCSSDGRDHSRCNHWYFYCNRDGQNHSSCRHERGWCSRDGRNHSSCDHSGNRCYRDTRDHYDCNHSRNICRHDGNDHWNQANCNHDRGICQFDGHDHSSCSSCDHRSSVCSWDGNNHSSCQHDSGWCNYDGKDHSTCDHAHDRCNCRPPCDNDQPPCKNEGFPGVTVQLQDSGGTILATQITATNGSYAFTNLAAGTYQVVVVQPAGYFQTLDPDGVLDNRTEITLAVCQAKRHVNFTYEAPPVCASIAGTVRIDCVSPGLPHCHDECNHDRGCCNRDGNDHSRCNHEYDYCNHDGSDHSGCRHERGWCDRDGRNHSSCNHQSNRCDRDTRDHYQCQHSRNICLHDGNRHDECNHSRGFCGSDGRDHSQCNHWYDYCSRDGQNHSSCRHERGWCSRDGRDHGNCDHSGGRCYRDTRDHYGCNHSRNICLQDGNDHWDRGNCAHGRGICQWDGHDHSSCSSCDHRSSVCSWDGNDHSSCRHDSGWCSRDGRNHSSCDHGQDRCNYQPCSPTPFAGVTVHLITLNGTILDTRTTAPDGSYEFRGLNPATYQVVIVPPLSYLQTRDPDSVLDNSTVLTLACECKEKVDFGYKYDPTGSSCQLGLIVTPQTNVVVAGTSARFTMVPTGGTAPYQVVWSGPNGFSSTDTSITIGNAQLSNAGIYRVSVRDANGCTNSGTGRLIVEPFDPLQVTRVRMLNVVAGPGELASVPVELVAQGDENALSFSLTFDPTKLTFSSATLASIAPAGANLAANINQADSGRVGVFIFLPTGETLPIGTQQWASVNFLVGSLVQTQVLAVAFGDQPVLREVLDPLAQDLSATYTDGSITVGTPVALNITQVRAGSMSSGPGEPATIPVEVVAEGTENALGFSLAFDPTKLTFTSATLAGNAPAGATLIANLNQVGSGRLGLLVFMPAGATLPGGTQQLAAVSFMVNSNVPPTQIVPVTFGDTPLAREVVDALAANLPAAYTDGSVTVVPPMLEADVSPRSRGDGVVKLADYVQAGRFAAGLDTVPLAEFQRADCAPRGTLGDGRITPADWVQAGRYALGVDAPAVCGGPATAVVLRPSTGPGFLKEESTARTVSVTGVNAPPGGEVTLPVRMAAQGGENAVSFTVLFDPARMTFKGAAPGAGWTGSIVNTTEASAGKVGVMIGLPINEASAAGDRDVVLLTFNVAADATGTELVSFADQPTSKEVVDVEASALSATYISGTVVFAAAPPPTVAFTLSDGKVVLTWSSTAQGFELESTEDLTGGWTKVNATPQLVGDRYVVSLPQPNGAKHFYRLHKQQ